MKIEIEGSAKEIAALVLLIQERQEEITIILTQTKELDEHLEPCTRKSDYLFGMRVPGWPNDGYGE